MTAEVLDTFQGLIEEIKSRDDVRVVVVEGSGKTFCSGADFKSIGGGNPLGNSISGEGVSGNGMEDKVRGIYSKFLAITELEVPTIAKVNGHAIGGGLGLVLACDLRVVCKTVKLGVNFTKLGLSPGMATTYMLPRIVGLPRAAELFFTGRIFTGEYAEQIGLANYACDSGEIDRVTDELASDIAASAPLAVRLTKRALIQGQSMEPASAMSYEAGYQVRTMQSGDCMEGITAMLQKRVPDFQGK